MNKLNGQTKMTKSISRKITISNLEFRKVGNDEEEKIETEYVSAIFYKNE